MRKTWFLGLAAGLLTSACGGDSSNPSLAGTDWQVQSDSTNCTLEASFDDAMGYSLGLACPLAAGGTGLQVELGSYAISGGTFTTTARQATCPTTEKVTSYEYKLTANNLILSNAAGVLTFVRSMASSGRVATYGCFGSDLAFTESPLSDL